MPRGVAMSLVVALVLVVWVQLARSAALSERPPEQRFLLPHRTFTKVYHFRSTTTVVAPAVCFSIPAHLSECGPGIQPSTTISPESTMQTAFSASSDPERPEPLTNPLEMLRGSHMTPDSEELLGPDRDTWGFFGLTIDSTVTRVITDLETQRRADPARTATLVLDGCRPTASVPQPLCPASALLASTPPPREEITLGGNVAMATQPLPTVAVSGQGATTNNNDPDDGQTGGATTNANWRENQVLEHNEGIIAVTISDAQEIKIPQTAEFTEAPPTTDATTMAELEQEKGEEKFTSLPPPVTMRLNLRVLDAQPATQIAHGILVVKPQSMVEIALPNVDPIKERVQVQPLVPADMDIFASTVDAVRQLIGIGVKQDAAAQVTTKIQHIDAN